MEVVQAENGILRRKLQSKTEGLMILSKEVDSLRNDLNQMNALNECPLAGLIVVPNF